MRVAVYYNNQDVRLEERPAPRIGPGEILVRVRASGICGSDVMEWYRIKKAPRVLGHEIAGEVVEVGEGVERFRVGDRVVVSHHVPCNTCRFCLAGHHAVCETLRSTNIDPGGFAECIRVPALQVDRGVFPISPGISDEEATFVEPLACVIRGFHQARLRPGQSLLVLGSGISGLLHLLAAPALGFGRMIATDLEPYRLEAAKRCGAEAAFLAQEISPDRLKEANGGRLADCVAVCAGAPAAVKQAVSLSERGGTFILFAPPEPGQEIPLPLFEVWDKGMTVVTTYAGSPADLAGALALLESRRVDVRGLITHRLGLAETGLGFRLVAEAKQSLKVIIEPQR